jgi:hypothetical protein
MTIEFRELDGTGSGAELIPQCSTLRNRMTAPFEIMLHVSFGFFTKIKIVLYTHKTYTYLEEKSNLEVTQEEKSRRVKYR